MSALLVSQKEIFDELRLIDAGRQNIADKRTWLANERAKQQAIEQELWIAEKELAETDRELRERLQNLILDGELAPISLVFDENTRTIRWNGGSVKLGAKPFKIIKILYFAPNRRAKIRRLVERVWGISSKHHSTVKSTVSRLNSKLKKEKCPYKIVGAKCLQPIIYKKDPVTDKIKGGMNRPPIKGFKLVMRK
jgi:hypothetical protein